MTAIIQIYNFLQRDRHVPEFSENISIFKIEKAIKKTKNNKACGLDILTYEIFRKITCMHILHRVFNVCYETGKVPRYCGKGIINPIPSLML